MEWHWLGYIASAVVAYSLMTSQQKKLRWWNLLGAMLFAVYGFGISAYPVVLVNGFIAVVNVYFLFRIYQFESNHTG